MKTTGVRPDLFARSTCSDSCAVTSVGRSAVVLITSSNTCSTPHPASGPNATGSHDQRSEHIPRDQESALDQVEVALKLAVLVLDRDDPVVPDRVQRADEPVPAHLAETGQPWHLPSDAGGQHAVLVELIPVDLHVLGVDVEDARSEIAERARVVDELPHQVRRVEVE